MNPNLPRHTPRVFTKQVIFVNVSSNNGGYLAYWEYTYEDSMNLLAKLPGIAATIYKNLYRDGTPVSAVDPNSDWSKNFCQMLGYEGESVTFKPILCDRDLFK